MTVFVLITHSFWNFWFGLASARIRWWTFMRNESKASHMSHSQWRLSLFMQCTIKTLLFKKILWTFFFLLLTLQIFTHSPHTHTASFTTCLDNVRWMERVLLLPQFVYYFICFEAFFLLNSSSHKSKLHILRISAHYLQHVAGHMAENNNTRDTEQ